jgi:hypothetical protein
MRIIAAVICVACLYLAYRFRPTERTQSENGTKTGGDEGQTSADEADLVAMSRFNFSPRSISKTTAARKEAKDSQVANADIFAAGKDRTVSSSEASVASDAPETSETSETSKTSGSVSPDELDIEYDGENESVLEEEREEIIRLTGDDGAETVEETGENQGMTFEEMAASAEAVGRPSENNAGLLLKIENTEVMDKLVGNDPEHAAFIKAVITRHLNALYPEAAGKKDEDDEEDDLKNFDTDAFLKIKRNRDNRNIEQ